MATRQTLMRGVIPGCDVDIAFISRNQQIVDRTERTASNIDTAVTAVDVDIRSTDVRGVLCGGSSVRLAT
ncbi:hypothetical protein D3C80_1027590 [compost metagenome]